MSPYQRLCKCVNHEAWTKNRRESNPLHHVKKSKKVKKKTLTFLRNHGYLSEKEMLICELCFQYVEDVLMTRKNITTSLLDSITQFMDNLDKHSPEQLAKIDEDIWINLFRKLGEKVIQRRLCIDVKKNDQTYKSSETLSKLDVKTYIGNLDKVVNAFLIGITGKQLIDTGDFDCNVADHDHSHFYVTLFKP